MVNVFNFFKDYVLFVLEMGVVAKVYAIILIATAVGILLYIQFGYTASIIRGSRRTIRFFNDKGWVDNSNISAFITKCVRWFPFAVRANFSLYNSYRKNIREYINENSFTSRDYAIRERLVKCIYDFVLGAGALLVFIYMAQRYDLFDSLRYLWIVPFGLIARYIIVGLMLYSEVRGRKVFLKAIDLMVNGIFLPVKEHDNNNEQQAECKELIEDTKDSKVTIDKTKAVADKLEDIISKTTSKTKVTRISKDEGIIVDKENIKDIAVDKTH